MILRYASRWNASLVKRSVRAKIYRGALTISADYFVGNVKAVRRCDYGNSP